MLTSADVTFIMNTDAIMRQVYSKEGITVTNYREILRLKSQGYSERNIALAVSGSRNTVSDVLKRAASHQIS